ESALHVAPPLVVCEPYLARSSLRALQDEWIPGDPGQPVQLPAEDRSLIEPPLEQPPAIERHGHDEVGVAQQLRSCFGEPPSEQAPGYVAVSVLEAVDEVAQNAVEMSDSAGAVVVWGICFRLGRHGAATN